MSDERVIDGAALRARFHQTTPFTVGLEEEVLLVDRASGLPAPVADAVVSAAADHRVKRELPDCQVELMTDPHAGVDGAISELASARTLLRRAAGDDVVPVAAAVHPTVARAQLGASGRYAEIRKEYGAVAELQLVGALQVHVAIGDADDAVAVHDALRGHLPDVAALAAAAPFHAGADTGLASVRPLICGLLPRQGVPPALGSFDRFVEELAWGERSGAVQEPRRWWWEARLHPLHGTIEVRVADVQPTVDDAAAVASFVRAVVRWLTARHRDGEQLEVAPTWRIEENRWRALRDGVHGTLLDLVSGEPEPAAARLHRLADLVAPWSDDDLQGVHRLVEAPAVDGLRAAGPDAAIDWLAERF